MCRAHGGNGQYGAFMGEVMSALSAPFLAEHRFPPPDYKSPCSYESLCCKAR